MKQQIIYEKKIFYRRLKALGFNSYDEYLKSDHWKSKKDEYRNSGLPQHCLVCKNKNYALHHRSYVNLGDESLSDFVPLCKKCHNKVHKWIKENDKNMWETHTAIRKVFKLSRKETRELFSPISKGKGFKFRDYSRIDILSKKIKNKSETKHKMKKEKDLEYPVRGFRLSDEVYDILKKEKIESRKSWNLYFKKIINKYKRE